MSLIQQDLNHFRITKNNALLFNTNKNILTWSTVAIPICHLLLCTCTFIYYDWWKYFSTYQ